MSFESLLYWKNSILHSNSSYCLRYAERIKCEYSIVQLYVRWRRLMNANAGNLLFLRLLLLKPPHIYSIAEHLVAEQYKRLQCFFQTAIKKILVLKHNLSLFSSIFFYFFFFYFCPLACVTTCITNLITSTKKKYFNTMCKQIDVLSNSIIVIKTWRRVVHI